MYEIYFSLRDRLYIWLDNRIIFSAPKDLKKNDESSLAGQLPFSRSYVLDGKKTGRG